MFGTDNAITQMILDFFSGCKTSSAINRQSIIKHQFFLWPLAFVLPFSLTSQTNLSLLGRKTFSEDLSDVWGFAANGKEYALVGLYSGVSIVDVTNPASPTQLFFVTTAQSDWHDIATWNGYAYVTNETGGGLTIINLNYLPDSIRTYTSGGGIGLTKAHTVFTDENGIAYVAGGNMSAGRGVLMFDVNTNPIVPSLVGRYDVHYVHDVFVRGDTMWTAEINDGMFAVVDISNKGNPVILADNFTPARATHNLWLSDDGTTLLTTDEINNAYLASYDVSDLGNITLLDTFRFNPGTNSLVHNVHYVGGFAVASCYRDGVVIIDASDPENLIAVGNYDTSPLWGGGFNGCWSVYPYLPSGNILASDIEQGLFVLAPLYKKACYLEGIVTDIVSGQPLDNVAVTILPSNPTDYTRMGKYKTGIADSGTYSVRFSKSGYRTHMANHVRLTNGVVTTLHVRLIPAIKVSVAGTVRDAGSAAVPGSIVLFANPVNSYLALTDSLGSFTIDSFDAGEYGAFAGKWGYVTAAQDLIVSSDTSLTVVLQKGYYDDFILDFGWMQTSTAASGHWVRGEPAGTNFNLETSNPDSDVLHDFGDECFVTGNGGGQAGFDDVDDGTVTLISPPFDLSGYFDPYISYHRWFFNAGANTSPNDTLLVKLTNGVDTHTVEHLSGTGNNAWRKKEVRVRDFLPLGTDMRIIFETADRPSTPHLVEAAVDMFSVFDSLYPPAIDFHANRTQGCPGDTFIIEDNSLYEPHAWLWQFPGGMPASSTEQNPIVIYLNPGVYSVTLSATNAGGTATLEKPSFIVIHQPPSVQAAITKTSDSLSHDGSIALSISGNAPFAIAWSTGSTDSILQNLTAGNYSLTVTDAFGCTVTQSFTVNVTPTQLPAVNFTSDKTDGCPGDTFLLTDLSMHLPETWLWLFPGGTPSSSSQQNALVVYSSPGEYDITLSVSNDAGAASLTRQGIIRIHEPPGITAVVTDASSSTAHDGRIEITIDGSPPFTIAWSNGSSGIVLQNLPAGTYSVMVMDSWGCKSYDTLSVSAGTSLNTLSATVNIFPNPLNQSVTVESAVPVWLSFFNSRGHKLNEMNLQAGQRIDWGRYQMPGVYFMAVSPDASGNKRKIIKLVKIN